jgi:predicted metalloprotease
VLVAKEKDMSEQQPSLVQTTNVPVSATAIFAGAGKTYRPPTLVLFSGATQSGYGFAKAAMGPFYCPIDQNEAYKVGHCL